MRTFEMKAVPSIKLSRRSISRFIAALLAISILQFAGVFQAPSSFGAAGYVGPTTGSGTCSSYVGEAIGVTATFVNDSFCLIKFNNSTTWTSPTGVRSFETLLVGGGGGGGADGGGGGGGGEVRLATSISVADGAVSTITIAGGGAGNSHTPGIAGGNGGTSSVVVNSTTYSANGGSVAVGWLNSANYAAGGSGGSNGTQLTGGTDYSKGGRNSVQANGYALGGYGTVGFAGVTTSFTGTSLTFAGGGGGGICTDTKSESSFGGLAGGSGGGGRGAFHTQNVGSDAGQPGTNGLGGGGGGGSACNDGGTNGSNARTAGGRGGDGVVYIKFVPVISITTNPQSASGTVGGTTTFSATPYAALTGATRTKKWQVLVPNGSWSDISGATSDSYTTPTITRAMQNNHYRYLVTDTFGTAVSTTISSAATLTVPPPLLLGDSDTALTATGITYGYTTLAGAEELTPAAADDFTIEAWIRPTDACSATRCTIIAREGVVRLTYYQNRVSYAIWNGNTATWRDLNFASLPLNQWSHVAINKTLTTVKVFINGNEVASDARTYSPQTSNNAFFYVGNIVGATEPFKGSIDEVKIWKSARAANIATDMNSNASATTGLVAYWNFNEGRDGIAYNQVLTGSAGTDLTLYATNYWDAAVISDVTTSSAYTIRTFKRSYITSSGGWRAPLNVTQVQALVVAGGGAGGSADSTAYEAGGGGGGGVLTTKTILVPQSIYSIVVGYGGVGEVTTPTNGGDSLAFALTAYGGGYGAYALGVGGNGGSGGGGTHNMTIGGTGVAGQGFAGQKPGVSSSGGGGGGAAATPIDGKGGVGLTSNISGSNFVYGDGGGASIYNGALSLLGGSGNGGTGASAMDRNGSNAVTNSGGGGGGAYSSTSAYKGGNGGTGVVIVRWITATKPIFTQPVIDTLTAGLIETFTVSNDPVSPLTRNFRWQTSSDTGTTWTDLSVGSGFRAQTYSTPTLETTTSGIRYQYRVIVTDSDTAGLFIIDTSTAVYLIINPRILITGSYTIQKYGATHVDTFTTVAGTGTGTETFTFSPNNRTGITWNGSTPNQATLTIARTLGPGTYYETMTATDTKGAFTQLGIAIVVSKADTITVTSLGRVDTFTASALTFSPGYTVSGLQNSDTVTSISWSYSGTENSSTAYGPSATKPINAGSYTITPSGTISNSDSYTAVVYETSTLTINRATRTLTASISPSPLKFGANGTINAAPSAGSGDGAITYSTANTDSCTVTSANVQAIKSSGTCSIAVRVARGNNYESATATSINLSLAKADTLSVIVNAINPVTYTGNPAAVSPTVTVAGLALTNSVGANPVAIAYVGQGNIGSSCAQGGTCIVGDTGPGGGIVFYVAPSLQSWGRYLEAAPATWSGGPDNQAGNISKWCEAATSVDSTKFTGFYNGIGLGYDNTYDSRLNVCTGGAIYKARTYRGGGYTNWFLPNSTELALMADISVRSLIGLVNDSNLWGYWGSYEDAGTGFIGSLVTNSWGIGATNKAEATKNMTRPIRAFAEGGVGTTTFSSPPTDAGTYTVKASSLTLSSGSLSDYQGVTYTDGSLLINRANQQPLVIAQYAAVFGTPYKVMIYGGSGLGALTQVVSAGTATGCTLSGDTLTSTTVGTCNLTATKARDKNYETATAVAYVYFLTYTINQPVATPSTSSEIALSGATSVTLESTAPPSITGLSTLTLSLSGGGTFTITGTGFAGSITVKFWRNKSISATSGNGTTITIPVSSIQSAGATSGRIAVITSAGEAVSIDSLSITP